MLGLVFLAKMAVRLPTLQSELVDCSNLVIVVSSHSDGDERTLTGYLPKYNLNIQCTCKWPTSKQAVRFILLTY